jgi:N-acetylglucosamine-6-phosphate deacetylase
VSAVLFRGAVVWPDGLLEDGAVLCTGGRIAAVGAGAEVEAPPGALEIDGAFVAPGFVDIHVHGGDGADFMDGTLDAALTATRAHARHGTTTIFPTTTTGSPEQLEAMLAACASVPGGSGAHIAGVHLYGPFFAAEKLGCHGAEGRRDPDPGEYERYLESGVVRIATCAAELPGAEAYYRAAAARGCLVTCGHSNASWGEMERAFAAGVRHVDHFWCAMSSVASVAERLGTPMQGSMEQFVLLRDEMSTEVIADGAHLAPELLEFAFRVMGPSRLCLVTDSSRALDMPPGEYRFGPEADGEPFESDGVVGRQGARLASSVSGMDRMVRTMVGATSASLAEVVRMATLTPAERAGIADEVGSLEPGKRADVLVLGSGLEVERVFLVGEEVSLGAAESIRRGNESIDLDSYLGL